MNQVRDRYGCEREPEVARALRMGLVSPELREHILGCVICTEAQAVGEMMLRVASVRSAESDFPAAGLVWRRAEARRKEIALRRAIRPLIFMRVLGGVYVALSMVWFLHSFWRGSLEAMSGWNLSLSTTIFFVAVIAVLAIVIGAGFLLRDSRRFGARVAST